MLDSTDYGMIGMLAIFTAVANSIQESGFTAALANKQTFRHEDYNAVFWFSFLMGASLYLLLFFCAPFIAAFYKTPQLIPLSRFLFLGFLISSCGTAHNAVLFKKLMVKEKAKATITALLCSGTIGIVMAYNRMAFWGLAVQQITYIFIANALLWYFSPWRPTFSFNFKPIREMLPFSSKLLITNVFHYINDNIFSVLLGRFYTSQDVGYYTQANKWTNMGFSLISKMITEYLSLSGRNLFRRHATEKYISEDVALHRLYLFPRHVRTGIDSQRVHRNCRHRQMAGMCTHHADSLHLGSICPHYLYVLQSSDQ